MVKQLYPESWMALNRMMAMHILLPQLSQLKTHFLFYFFDLKDHKKKEAFKHMFLINVVHSTFNTPQPSDRGHRTTKKRGEKKEGEGKDKV